MIIISLRWSMSSPIKRPKSISSESGEAGVFEITGDIRIFPGEVIRSAFATRTDTPDQLIGKQTQRLPDFCDMDLESPSARASGPATLFSRGLQVRYD